MLEGIMNERGQYGSSNPSAPRKLAIPTRPASDLVPWSASQDKDFQRSLAAGALGSVAGAVLWKSHRIWGFLLGGMAGHAIGNLAFAPPTDYLFQSGHRS